MSIEITGVRRSLSHLSGISKVSLIFRRHSTCLSVHRDNSDKTQQLQLLKDGLQGADLC